MTIFLAQGTSAPTIVAIVGLIGTFITALASLVGVLINSKKTSDVQGKVDGQLTTLIEKWEMEHDARLRAEVELAVLKEREGRGEH